MLPHRRRRYQGTPEILFTQDERAVRRLTAQMLLDLGAVKNLVTEHGFQRGSVAVILGVEELEEEAIEDRKAVIEKVRNVCVRILKENSPDYPANLEANVARLRQLVRLDDVAADILKFAVMLHYSQELDDACDLLEEMTSAKAVRALSVILGHRESDIKRALAPRSPLALSGLVTLDRSNSVSLKGKLDLLSGGFADAMVNYEGEDLYELFKEAVRPVSEGTLGLEDFDHMAKECRMLLDFLSHAMAKRKRGTNLLIYGAPGTGKTELVKAMAAKLQAELFEISYADEDDEPITGKRRINAFKSAQYLFGDKPVLLLFDEIEDVFNDVNPMPALLGMKPAQEHKGWMNRILENAQVPTLWLSNSIGMMDPATIRRFDIVLKMPSPTRSKRLEIAETVLGDRVSDRLIDTIGEHDRIAPALITRAAAVLEMMDAKGEKADERAMVLISQTLRAQGHAPLSKPRSFRTADYDPAFVNAQEDLSKLADGIAKNPHARLCLYGPPGTGKSAFGRWLAERLDRPYHVKKSSDLLSMWVGGTEANIARAFEEAERDGAVLIFDEIDGFLQERREAQRSWEVTQVNELLTQMEAFEGIFVATTNLMEGLDRASLRRFDVKLKFDFMGPDQSRAMFLKVCRDLGLKTPSNAVIRSVEGLKNLTPGDFAAILRRNRFSPIDAPIELAERLAEECRKKAEVGEQTVGFRL